MLCGGGVQTPHLTGDKSPVAKQMHMTRPGVADANWRAELEARRSALISDLDQRQSAKAEEASELLRGLFELLRDEPSGGMPIVNNVGREEEEEFIHDWVTRERSVLDLMIELPPSPSAMEDEIHSSPLSPQYIEEDPLPSPKQMEFSRSLDEEADDMDSVSRPDIPALGSPIPDLDATNDISRRSTIEAPKTTRDHQGTYAASDSDALSEPPTPSPIQQEVSFQIPPSPERSPYADLWSGDPYSALSSKHDATKPLSTPYTLSLNSLSRSLPVIPRRKPKRSRSHHRPSEVAWQAAALSSNPATKHARFPLKCMFTKDWMVLHKEFTFLQAISKIDKLQAEGKWSLRQPKRQKGPPVPKSHWDYLLDEMAWMSTDFSQERRWKSIACLELGLAVKEWHAATKEERNRLCVRWKKPSAPTESVGNDRPYTAYARQERSAPTMMNTEDPETEDDAEVDVNDDITPEEGTARHAQLVDAGFEEDEEVLETGEYLQTSQNTNIFEQSDEDMDAEGEADVDGEGEPDGEGEVYPSTNGQNTQQSLGLDDYGDDDSASEPGQDVMDDADMDAEGEEDAEGDDEADPNADRDADADGDAEDDMQDAEGEAEAGGMESTDAALAEENMDGSAEIDQHRMQDFTENLRSASGDIDMSAMSHVLERMPKLEPPDSPEKELGDTESPFRDKIVADGAFLMDEERLDFHNLRAPILDLPPTETFVDLHEITGQDNLDSLFDLFPDLIPYGMQDPTEDAKRIDNTQLPGLPLLMQVKPVLVSALRPGSQAWDGEHEDWDNPVEEPKDGGHPGSIPSTLFVGRKAKDPSGAVSVPPHPPRDFASRVTSMNWTNEDDAILLSTVSRYGDNWDLVADAFNTKRMAIPTDHRTPWDCHERWTVIRPLDSSARQMGKGRGTEYQPPRIKTIRPEGTKKRERQAALRDAIRKSVKKREASNIKQSGVAKRINLSAHDTHGSLKGQVMVNPADMAKQKFERDQVQRLERLASQRRVYDPNQRIVPQILPPGQAPIPPGQPMPPNGQPLTSAQLGLVLQQQRLQGQAQQSLGQPTAGQPVVQQQAPGQVFASPQVQVAIVQARVQQQAQYAHALARGATPGVPAAGASAAAHPNAPQPSPSPTIGPSQQQAAAAQAALNHLRNGGQMNNAALQAIQAGPYGADIVRMIMQQHAVQGQAQQQGQHAQSQTVVGAQNFSPTQPQGSPPTPR